MKTAGRGIGIAVLLVGVCICFSPPSPAAAADGNAQRDFEIRADGTVRAGGEEFASLSEYVRSDYFKTAG